MASGTVAAPLPPPEESAAAAADDDDAVSDAPSWSKSTPPTFAVVVVVVVIIVAPRWSRGRVRGGSMSGCLRSPPGEGGVTSGIVASSSSSSSSRGGCDGPNDEGPSEPFELQRPPPLSPYLSSLPPSQSRSPFIILPLFSYHLPLSTLSSPIFSILCSLPRRRGVVRVGGNRTRNRRPFFLDQFRRTIMLVVRLGGGHSHAWLKVEMVHGYYA